MATNPFTAEVEAANAAALNAFTAAANLTGDAAKAKLAQAAALTDAAHELTLASIEWRTGRLSSAVTALETMFLRASVRQSDIAGRLRGLGQKIGAQLPGSAPVAIDAAPPQPEPVPAPEPLPEPAPITDAAPTSAAAATPAPVTVVVPAVAAAPIDPNKRHTSLDLLHPSVRKKVEALVADLATADVPMVVFESFRTPERQDHLFAVGRTREMHRSPVTFVRAWHSYHQFGMAVDMVLDHKKTGMNPWETKKGNAPKWWKKFHELADKNGLERLSFELPHIQEPGIRHSALMAGEQPGPGDESWATNFASAVARWQGAEKPILPPDISLERPSLAPHAATSGVASAGIDWGALPPVKPVDWGSKFGGQEWRVDSRGVYLRNSPNAPLRTPGDPMTASKVVELYGDELAEASRAFEVPPELIVMTIVTETGAMKKDNFTGPRTFRWEQHVTLTTTGTNLDGREKGDYSAGPMQVLSNTARDVNNKLDLGFDNKTDLKWFKNRPAKNPAKLGLYVGRTGIMIGAGYISMQSGKTHLNPILSSAAYNAGSVRASGTNNWGLHTHGDHLDRASKWFGDACAVFAALGRS